MMTFVSTARAFLCVPTITKFCSRMKNFIGGTWSNKPTRTPMNNYPRSRAASYHRGATVHSGTSAGSVVRQSRIACVSTVRREQATNGFGQLRDLLCHVGQSGQDLGVAVLDDLRLLSHRHVKVGPGKRRRWDQVLQPFGDCHGYTGFSGESAAIRSRMASVNSDIRCAMSAKAATT